MDKRNESKTPAPQQDVIVLGVASVETKGPGVGMEPAGPGQRFIGGISKE